MSDKSIIRVQKHKGFSIISNVHLNDDRLSWKAKGILTYLLSKPDDWQVYVRDLVKRSTDGRDAVYSGLKELSVCGYVVSETMRNEKGKITGTAYYIIENPGFSPHTDFPDTVKPDTENPDTDTYLEPNTDINKKLTTTTEKKPEPEPVKTSSSFSLSSDVLKTIPAEFRKSSVLGMIQTHNLSDDRLIEYIKYAVENCQNRTENAFRAYLDRALSEGWIIPEESAETATPLPDGTKIKINGDEYRIDAGNIRMESGFVPVGMIRQMVTEGKAKIVS